MKRKRTDPDIWLARVVQFGFGAIFGAMVGVTVWSEWTAGTDWGWLPIPIGALAFGIVVAIVGDSFWMSGTTWRDWKK